MEVPKPILNFETTSASPLVAPEYHDVGASPAPDNLVVSPGPSEYHECDASPNPLPSGPVVLSADPPENHVAVRTAPESPVRSIGPQEPDAAAKPAPNSLLPSIGPSESLELNLADAMSNSFPPPQDLPTPQLSSNSAVQHRSSRSRTPRIDLQKYRAKKRQHTGATGDKARLVPQDVLTTRVAIQEKDRIIELLKNEVSGYIGDIERG